MLVAACQAAPAQDSPADPAAHSMMAARTAQQGTSLLLEPCCVLQQHLLLPMWKTYNPPQGTSAAACAHAALSWEHSTQLRMPLQGAAYTTSVPWHPSPAVSNNANNGGPRALFRTLSLLIALGPLLLLLLVLKVCSPATTGLPTAHCWFSRSAAYRLYASTQSSQHNSGL